MIRGLRVILLAGAIACLATGFTLSGLWLVGGSLILHPWDRDDDERG